MLVSRDDILNRPRVKIQRQGVTISEFVDCPYCSGFWIALAWWGAWQLWPHGVLIAASAVAITAILPLIERLTD